MTDAALVIEINKTLSIVLPGESSFDELKLLLADYFNELIQTNFPQLISLLYRIDVSEQKLADLLALHPGSNAGNIIADLVIERQLQKIKTRRQFSQTGNNITDEEKW